ncbi:MAG: WHG domain-containing protein [Butyrivibrio sp.]|nr:WHG domain-containing protein [Acetatifactor muris]MCM1561143.1 WHG domain-containing protein [Butyrivibrio sp.]
MPPKFKFTKEEISNAALNITRKSGLSGLTARALAAELGCSVKPIFGLFENMEEVQRTVYVSAQNMYRDCLQKDMAEGKYPPYKASGMAYIRFAKEERELFRLLFMRDRSREEPTENREEIRPLLELIQRNLGISEDEAYLFHIEMWLYVHGIATMIATSYLDWQEEFISKVLTDAYMGLKYRYSKLSDDSTLEETDTDGGN